MKIKLFAFFAATIASAVAASLASNTTVHTKPDATAPVIASLKAGTSPVAAPGTSAPTGWMAVELPGPFEGYVENKDLEKSLDVKEGAAIRLTPKADGAVLATAAKGDKTTITGLRGKWTQISLEKKLVGYIRAIAPAPAPAPTPVAAAPSAAAPLAPPPVSPRVYGVATPGQAAPMLTLSDGGSTTLPRQFAGRFVSTRRPLAPRRPYDYALNDNAGKRYAYLDISKLLLTEQIEKYIDHNVVVFGAARATADGREIVIEVETLQLR